MVRRDVDLLSELRYPKAYGFVFLGGARFPLSWDLATTAKSLQQHQFVHSRRESCIIAAAKSGLRGALLYGGIEGKVVGHHLKLCAVISVSQPLRYGKSNIEPWLCMSRRLAMNMASMRSLLGQDGR